MKLKIGEAEKIVPESQGTGKAVFWIKFESLI